MTVEGAVVNSTRRILAVDDDAIIRRLVQSTLQKQGFTVMSVGSGQEALELIEENPPDLVVLDVQMPEMDGFEVLRRIRRTARTARLPVVMLTAMADEGSVHEGWMTGADMYLTKPIRPNLLIEAIQEIFSTLDGEQERVIGLPVRPSGAHLPVPRAPSPADTSLASKLVSLWSAKTSEQ